MPTSKPCRLPLLEVHQAIIGTYRRSQVVVWLWRAIKLPCRFLKPRLGFLFQSLDFLGLGLDARLSFAAYFCRPPLKFFCLFLDTLPFLLCL